MEYELVIGLETHVRVGSDTKMFCRCRNSVDLSESANTDVCPICMGFPGALPALSERVVDLAVRASHALRCRVNTVSNFDRKSYFYPDLPSGYQITQLYHPIAEHGEVRTFVGDTPKTFRVHRMHIETDAGKLIHAGSLTLCDYNRSCSPLMEIVTEPDFRSKAEVQAYLEELQKLMRACGASDADMEKGHLRCDVNISLRPIGTEKLGNRVEIKNVNSFSAIGRAIDYEVARQTEMLNAGARIDQETRGWNDEKGVSQPQRSKEDAMDYRYFPEPDLPPLIISDAYIAERKLAELPMERREKYLQWGLLWDDARILSADRSLSDFYEALAAATNDPKKSCSYITSILFSLFETAGETVNFENLRFNVSELAEVIKLVNSDALSSTNAKTVVEELFKNGGKTEEIVERLGLKQVNDTAALEAIVNQVIAENGEQIAAYLSGNDRVFGFLVGQCMKASAGRGNPKVFTDLLKKAIHQ